MTKSLVQRWQAWRDPEARRARKAARRRASDEAFSEAKASSTGSGPKSTDVYRRGMGADRRD
jgi:hypothetical protein